MTKTAQLVEETKVVTDDGEERVFRPRLTNNMRPSDGWMSVYEVPEVDVGLPDVPPPTIAVPKKNSKNKITTHRKRKVMSTPPPMISSRKTTEPLTPMRAVVCDSCGISHDSLVTVALPCCQREKFCFFCVCKIFSNGKKLKCKFCRIAIDISDDEADAPVMA